jgi:membrane fusion protein, multidrug efflux system
VTTRRIVALLAIVAGLAGCSKHDETPVSKAMPPAAARVAVKPALSETVPDGVEAVGTVTSRRRTVLSAKVMAGVTAVSRREGDRVRADEVLVELDDRDLRAQLERAQAAVREARDALEETAQAIQGADAAIDAASAGSELASATLHRYATLYERRSVSPHEYDEVAARAKSAAAELARAGQARAQLVAKQQQAGARIEQADAAVASARVALSYARIVAPSAGVVVTRTVEPGNVAAPGAPLLTIEEERYRLELAVPERDAGKLRIGQRGTVTIDALGRPLDAAITEILPAADPQTRTLTVRLDLPGSADLRSGLYGTARFWVGQRAALLLPRAAIGRRGQLERVFVVDQGNVARMRLVTTGKTYGDRVEILSGLDPGERVVVEGAERVTDGGRVEPS